MHEMSAPDALHADEVARLRKENALLRTLVARIVYSAGGSYVVPREVLLRGEIAELRLEAVNTPSGLEVRLRPVEPPRPTAQPAVEAAPEPVAEPVAEPEAEPAAEVVAVPEAEPAVEPAAEPLPEPEAESIVMPVVEPVAEPAPKALTQSEIMAMSLAAFEQQFGFRPDEALEKYWFAITGKRLGRAERAAIVASMAGRMPDLRHVVME